jgi:pyridoxine 4-dehydrogenase
MDRDIELLGSTLPRIGFGTLYVTEQRGFGPARADAVDVLREAKDLGVRFFDTADSYGNGSAESAMREALHPYDGLIVATKAGFRHDRLHAWTADARPAHLREALEGSLRRLGVEAITLYQLHCPDHRVPYAESVGTLADMRREGKIRHIGVSNVSLGEIETARREVEIVSVQNPYNIRRGWRNDVIDYCETNGLVFIPWMPLGDGGISWNDPILQRIAAKHGATPPRIALAALLHRSPVVLPIPGTSSIDHLRDNVAAAGIALDEDDLAALWPDRR